jgi:pimeloyl-ACP methyl ester carboxylesterase
MIRHSLWRTMAWATLAVGLAWIPAQAQQHPVPPSTVMPPERFTTVFGQTMAYYDISNGPVLVLVHGHGTSATIDWGQVIRPLSEKYRVIAIDNIGFGDSAKPAIAYTMQTYVDFLAEFLRQMNIKHFYLDGESMGGGIVELYAIEAAQPGSNLPQVDKLILSDPAAPVPSTPTDEERSKHDTGARPAGLIPATPEEYKKGLDAVLFTTKDYATDAYARDVWQLLLRYNFNPSLSPFHPGPPTPLQQWTIEHTKDIHVPTLIVWGQDDKLIPVDHADYIHQQIAGSELWVVPETGHAVGMEKPNLYVEKVNSFLLGK